MKPIVDNIIQGLLFIVCAIPGLVLILVATLMLEAYFDPQTIHLTNNWHPAVSISVLAAGLLLVLVGVGKWKQWRYLFVFLAIPVSMWIGFLIPFGGGGKLLFPAFVGLMVFIVYRVVNKIEKKNSQPEGPDDGAKRVASDP